MAGLKSRTGPLHSGPAGLTAVARAPYAGSTSAYALGIPGTRTKKPRQSGLDWRGRSERMLFSRAIRAG
jgi:hypothetical protein